MTELSNMSEFGLRKFESTDTEIACKRAKASSDDSDDTSSEGQEQEEDERLQKMTQAIKTILEVW